MSPRSTARDTTAPLNGRDMREIDAIYRDGAHYDPMFGRGYVEFWLSQARITGGPILELGCGTGKLSIPLAQAGFSVAGLDNSPALLQFAASKSGDVKWIAGDMRSFDLDERFALIILPSNNLGHLHTPEDFESCISSVKRHLQPAGAFVIDVFVPNFKLLLRDAAEEYVLDEYDDPEGQGQVRVMAQSIYEPTTQIMRTKTIRKVVGQPDIVSHWISRCTFRESLRHSSSATASVSRLATVIMPERGSTKSRAFRSSSARVPEADRMMAVAESGWMDGA